MAQDNVDGSEKKRVKGGGSQGTRMAGGEGGVGIIAGTLSES